MILTKIILFTIIMTFLLFSFQLLENFQIKIRPHFYLMNVLHCQLISHSIHPKKRT